MNLNEMTHLELLELRSRIEKELQDLSNRSKHKVYTVKVPLVDNYYFIDHWQAKSFMIDQLTEGTLLDVDLNDPSQRISFGVEFVDESFLKFCLDQNKTHE